MSSKTILIVGPAWVGDMVMAQTLFQLLKERDPSCLIDVLAPAWTQALLSRMPEVRESIDLPLAHGELRLRDRYRLGVSLRARRYDQAIVLPNSFKSALVPYWARIPQRTGWLGEGRYGLLNDIRRLSKKQWPLMIQRFMALGLARDERLPDALPRPLLHIVPERVTQTLQRLNLPSTDQPVLGLCPGAEFGASKRWPAEYYAELAKAKCREGWQVWLLGSSKDKAITDAIDAMTGHRTVNLAGVTSLTDAVDLLSCTTLVVTNDSGLMHIAAALNRPLVVLYGSTSPAFTPPLSDQAHILQQSLPCSPCFQRECPLGHFKCMMELTPDRVIKTMESITQCVDA